MISKYKKLELGWPGKDIEVKPEPRVLIQDPEKSYGEADTKNMLIHADNLLALKALEQNFGSKIKCIYIDPPYNTGNAFEHYDDGLEHSAWLNLMKPRLELLYKLLDKDYGSIWISIDDDESHYLKVYCDELFGRKNFVANVIWQKKFSPQNDAKWFSDMHDHILVYAKNKELWKPNLLPRTEEMDSRYKNQDNDPRGVWSSSDLSVKTYSAAYDYPITTPSGKIIHPTQGRCWRTSKENFQKLVDDNRVWFGESGGNVPRLKRFLTDVKDGLTPSTIWYQQEVGHNQEARQEAKSFVKENAFTTPKPERLIERVIFLASNEGDIVLDSFLGSGTTAAVAHKMGRKWIGIELGEHCNTHCLPRLQAVCDGTDQGGISKAMDWQGGGGFKYYELAPSLLNKDKHNQWIINPQYNAQLLAAAVARHEGFTYSPNETIVWKQGFATENHFIFTTTNTITPDVVEQILSEMKPDESLRIFCKNFTEASQEISNKIEICKIPDLLLGRCEFGNEDYCTNIVNMPDDPDKPPFIPSYIKPEVKPSPAKISKEQPDQTKLLF
jgi:adenine-specific DNA-methyltransferase